MQRFGTYTESTNTHLEHVEDLLFLDGIEGARDIFMYLASVRDMLQGHAPGPVNVSQKWDGAPAIVVGTDPEDGKFYVAKKGVFNRTPLVYKSHNEIDRGGLDSSLTDMFHLAFDGLRKACVKLPGIQGDFLFTRSSIKSATIQGESYVIFHPNTIAYAVPAQSGLADDIMRADFGIAWHTVYNGQSLSSLSASYNAQVTKLLCNVSHAWMVDATYTNQAGLATMTAKETAAVSQALSEAGSILRTIPAKPLAAIADAPETIALVQQYNNQQVRSGGWLQNPTDMAVGLMEYAKLKALAEAEKRKTDRGKAGVLAASQEILQPLANMGITNLAACYRFMGAVTRAKILLTKQLDKLATTGTFVQTAQGYKATNPEGYVATDIMGNRAVKLVDRLEFSRNNFNPSIIKGWN